MVNGQPIPTLRVAALARQRRDRADAKGDPNPVAMRESLQQLMERELLFEEAVARGVTPNAVEIEQFYDRLKSGSDEAWKATLAREGLSPESLREEIRLQATVVALVAKLARTPDEVTEAQARARFEEHPELAVPKERYLLSRILVRPENESSPEARKGALERARSLKARLDSGSTFAELAREASDDVETRLVGGDMAPVDVGSLDPVVEEALAGLRPGYVTDVLDTKEGAVILKLRDRLSPEIMTFQRLLPQLRRDIVDDERRTAVKKLLEQLEARANIQVFL